MPVPEVVGLTGLGKEGVAEAGEEIMVDAQGQSRPRVAVRLSGESRSAPSQVPHLGARDVAVENLLNEQSDGGGRIELAFAPVMMVLAADSLEGPTIQKSQG